MNISQSLMNMVLDAQCCPYAVKLNYVDKLKSETTELMLRGHVFEYKLIGKSTSDKEIPELPKLQKGGLSQAEKDIDVLVEIAKAAMVKLGVDFKNSQVQVRLETKNGESGLLDMVTTVGGRKSIVDVKYTETKYDDRWNGWADLETRPESKRQARHYIKLWHDLFGEWLPYYFFVFGKSGWMRVLKCTLTSESLEVHEEEIQATRDLLKRFEKEGWKPLPSYEKCRDCYMMAHCTFVQTLPDIEQYTI